MNVIKRYWDTWLILAIIWCILNENFHWTTTLIGLSISFITIGMLHLLSSRNNSLSSYRLSPIILVAFLCVLFYQIIRSACSTTILIFQKKINPTIVELDTSLHHHWFQCLVANSITLTPGTVTVDKTSTHLKILWLYPTTSDPEEQAKRIFGSFEKILLKGEPTL